MRPDQFIDTAALVPTQAQPKKYIALPDSLIKLFNCVSATNLVFKHLSPRDIFNLLTACAEYVRFADVDLPCDISIVRYSGRDGLNIMLEDAKKFNFTRIDLSAKEINVPFVIKFLGNCISNQKEFGRKLLYRLDLSSINVNEQLV